MNKKLSMYTKCLILTTGLCTTHISFCPPTEPTNNKENKTETVVKTAYSLVALKKQDEKDDLPSRNEFKSWIPRQSSLQTSKSFVTTIIDRGLAKKALSDAQFKADLGIMLTESEKNFISITEAAKISAQEFETQRKAKRKAFDQEEKKQYEAFVANQQLQLQKPAQELHNLLSVYTLKDGVAPNDDMKRISETVQGLQKSIDTHQSSTSKTRLEDAKKHSTTEISNSHDMSNLFREQKNMMRALRRLAKKSNSSLANVSDDEKTS